MLHTRVIARAATRATLMISLTGASVAAQPVRERLDQYMEARAALGQFSGSVLVALHDTILLAKGYGYANLEQAVPNAADTRFAVASLTKQFTAVGIARLRDAGKLALSDSLCRYLASCPAAWRPVTLDQLVHHSSGIPDYEEALDLDSERYAQFMIAEDNTKHILDDAAAKPLDFPPGTRFHYSNTGYLLLGRVIEKVSGMPYADYMQREVLTPLGMTSSGILSRDRFVASLATGYSTGENGGSVEIAAGLSYLNGHFYRSTPISIMAGDHAEGGLFSTVEDLYRWDRALAHGSFVSRETARELFTPQRGGYAFGWVIGTRLGEANQSHTGILPGFVSRIDRFPDTDLTVIVLSNVNTSRFQQTSRDLAAIALGKPYDVPMARRLLARERAAEDRLTGTYVFGDGTELHVRSGERYLELQEPRQFTAGVIPERPLVYFAPLFEGEVTFSLDESGRGASVTLHYNGEDHLARRSS